MKTTKIIEIDGDKFATSLNDSDVMQLAALLVKAGLQKIRDGHIPSAESRYETSVYYIEGEPVEIKVTLTGKALMTHAEYVERHDEGERIYEAAKAKEVRS